MQMQYSDLPKVIRDKFAPTGELVENLLIVLGKLFHQSFFVQTFFKVEDNTAYLDDGNTKTKGARYIAFWVIAIGRGPKEGSSEYSDYYYGGGSSAIYIHQEQNIRVEDQKLCYGSGEIVITPFLWDDRNKRTRLLVNTDGGPYLTFEILTQLAHRTKLILAEHETAKEVQPLWYAMPPDGDLK